MTSDEFFTLKAIEKNGGKIYIKETYKVLLVLANSLQEKGALLKSISNNSAPCYYLTKKGSEYISEDI